MYAQLVTPNPATVGLVGYCLSFAEDCVGAAHGQYANATQAWNAAQFKHQDQNFPDAIVPIWFSYTNGNGNEGHVAYRYPDGRILSSPYKTGSPNATLPNMSELQRIYSNNGAHPLTYLGWSEDLVNVRVVQEGVVYIDEAVYQDLVNWKAQGLELTKDRDLVLYPQIEQQKEQLVEMQANFTKTLQENDQLKAQLAADGIAVQTAQKTAPKSTQASWFKKLLTALTGAK